MALSRALDDASALRQSAEHVGQGQLALPDAAWLYLKIGIFAYKTLIKGSFSDIFQKLTSVFPDAFSGSLAFQP